MSECRHSNFQCVNPHGAVLSSSTSKLLLCPKFYEVSVWLMHMCAAIVRSAVGGPSFSENILDGKDEKSERAHPKGKLHLDDPTPQVHMRFGSESNDIYLC